ncbi:amino acid permease [Clostridium felsineum]|uniref:amino acid permease n=1 Tax=Clostridium felsineum TaxID=36839 RepID=UPI00098C7168|nr:amino acid permease [Clostridium felsineum]MCR3761006.1 amino acid permease [Clostridium felsineum]
MLKIKRKNLISLFLFVLIFLSTNLFVPININNYVSKNITYNTVYASPRGGFHSGSFSSHSSSSSSSGGFKSGSFSNSHSSSSSSSKSSGSGFFGGSSHSSSSKRTYVPIPIPFFGHSYYGRGYSSFFFIPFLIKFILFVIVVVFIYKFLKNRRR